MERDVNNSTQTLQAPEGAKFGIVISRYNGDITGPMLQGALEVLREAGVQEEQIETLYVPGSFEIPFGALKLIEKNCTTIIALGCIIKGETEHDRHIANAVANGITKLSLERGVPISFGVLTTNNLEQAQVRSRGDGNKGKEAAHAAIQMAVL